MYKFKIEDRNKQKILFIHGYASSDASINAIRNEERNFDIITINLPFNQSNISINWYIDYVNNFIDKQNLKDFIVLGHSLGGAIAMGIKKAKKRILIAPLNPFSKPNKKMLIPENIEEAKISMKKLIFDYKSKWSESQIISMAKKHLIFTDVNKDNLQHLIKDEILNKDFIKNELKKIYQNKNFVIIQGENDEYISLKSSKETTKTYKCDIKIINNCGHSPLFEKPEETTKIINALI